MNGDQPQFSIANFEIISEKVGDRVLVSILGGNPIAFDLFLAELSKSYAHAHAISVIIELGLQGGDQGFSFSSEPYDCYLTIGSREEPEYKEYYSTHHSRFPYPIWTFAFVGYSQFSIVPHNVLHEIVMQLQLQYNPNFQKDVFLSSIHEEIATKSHDIHSILESEGIRTELEKIGGRDIAIFSNGIRKIGKFLRKDFLPLNWFLQALLFRDLNCEPSIAAIEKGLNLEFGVINAKCILNDSQFDPPSKDYLISVPWYNYPTQVSQNELLEIVNYLKNVK